MKAHPRSDAANRFAERRQREQDAPRLLDRVPALATLRLDVAAGRNATSSEPKHSRIIVVDAAPALFVLPCADHACREGGHDLTSTVLHALAAGTTHFELEDTCYGNVGSASCGRALHVQVTATYR